MRSCVIALGLSLILVTFADSASAMDPLICIEGDWAAVVTISDSETSEVNSTFIETADLVFGQLFIVSTAVEGEFLPFNIGFGYVIMNSVMWTDGATYTAQGSITVTPGEGLGDPPTQTMDGIISQFDGYTYGFTAGRP